MNRCTKEDTEIKCPIDKKFVFQKQALLKKLRRTQILSKKRWRGKIFLNECWWVVCPVDVVCKSLYTNHKSQSFFFNQWIDLGPAQSTFVCPTGTESSKLLQKVWELFLQNYWSKKIGGKCWGILDTRPAVVRESSLEFYASSPGSLPHLWTDHFKPEPCACSSDSTILDDGVGSASWQYAVSDSTRLSHDVFSKITDV